MDSSYFAIPLARALGIRAVVRVRNNLGYFLTPFHRPLSRWVGKMATVSLSNSEAGVRALVESEGLRPGRVEVMQNGVDLDRFRPTPRPVGSGITRVGAVANLRPVKNIAGLVGAAAQLCPRYPGLRFEVAGEGSERTALEHQIRAAGLADRFALTGACSDVPSFLASLDVAVLCSHSESMSNALLEYMAAGRPVVATDVGAGARIVRHGREGWIVPPGDTTALATAIECYLQAPELARAHGQAGRARAEAEYGRAAMVRRFEEFFWSFRKGRGPREFSRAVTRPIQDS
jgi:glycosyltransferase involved in cell wall biosynthesis